MKQSYTTPTVLLNGDVVRMTLSQNFGLAEAIGYVRKSGSVGFNL